MMNKKFEKNRVEFDWFGLKIRLTPKYIKVTSRVVEAMEWRRAVSRTNSDTIGGWLLATRPSKHRAVLYYGL